LCLSLLFLLFFIIHRWWARRWIGGGGCTRAGPWRGVWACHPPESVRRPIHASSTTNNKRNSVMG
jgi:hypothetical protein